MNRPTMDYYVLAHGSTYPGPRAGPARSTYRVANSMGLGYPFSSVGRPGPRKHSVGPAWPVAYDRPAKYGSGGLLLHL
ncbi:hypothetical protein TorRG33x02_230870 [Trema orientale]|uniref:Uncharacterized protein n=1 Tax=Trema orientale TaxID=63057 RepID=A0A2P5E6E9_TREOI|nr:hypothetical protein TorRG33x02_230870 [Trema orientale]